jgi:hypothetical protein
MTLAGLPSFLGKWALGFAEPFPGIDLGVWISGLYFEGRPLLGAKLWASSSRSKIDNSFLGIEGEG